MQRSSILLAKQDLMGFSQKDLKLLTQHHDIDKDIDKNDMAWLVAIKLHLKSEKALMPSDIPKPSEIEKLPAEIIVGIMSNLNMEDVLNLCLVNKDWYGICKDEMVWKLLYEKDFPEAKKLKNKTWYESYRIKFTAKIYVSFVIWTNDYHWARDGSHMISIVCTKSKLLFFLKLLLKKVEAYFIEISEDVPDSIYEPLYNAKSTKAFLDICEERAGNSEIPEEYFIYGWDGNTEHNCSLIIENIKTNVPFVQNINNYRYPTDVSGT
uniref:F-box-like family protein n=1 Tax=Marseillevirus LCMAC201 TaxID=2506605 RepID=A0A481YWS8_9VIRU|nr:MAG: F-box-like family protein [Marseillevirus LCMAC201]